MKSPHDPFDSVTRVDKPRSCLGWPTVLGATLGFLFGYYILGPAITRMIFR